MSTGHIADYRETNPRVFDKLVMESIRRRLIDKAGLA